MAEGVIISSLEELYKFINEKGVFEVVTRGKNKRLKTYYNVAIDMAKQTEGKEAINSVFEAISQNTNLLKINADTSKKALEAIGKNAGLIKKNIAISQKTLKALETVAKMQQLTLILSAANLCATCVGFAIMYKKLDSISGQINKLMSVVKEKTDIQIEYETQKIIAEHNNMLDCRKTHKYYTEEQMRKLVDDECNVLNMLINVFMKDLAVEQEALIFMIYSMAAMLSASVRFFDEIYYFNNKETIGEGNVWHSSHDKWMAVYDRLTSKEMTSRIQDLAIFDFGMTAVDTDVYCKVLFDQAKSAKEDIADNQKLIQAFGDEKLLEQYRKYIDQETLESIQNAFEETEGAMENEMLNQIHQESLKRVALAI